MDEVWVRVGIVSAALLAAGGIVLWQRLRERSPVRDLGGVRLSPGPHFFSSASCPTCDSARRRIEEALGDRYTEHPWESEPELFSELGIDAVPAILVVSESGRARLFPGQPERALSSL